MCESEIERLEWEESIHKEYEDKINRLEDEVAEMKSEFVFCRTCDGRGKVRANYEEDGKYILAFNVCHACNGTGVRDIVKDLNEAEEKAERLMDALESTENILVCGAVCGHEEIITNALSKAEGALANEYEEGN